MPISVKVIDHGQTALLEIQRKGKDEQIDLETIKQALTAAGVVYGIDEQALEEICSALEKSPGNFRTARPVATATPAVDGEDGKIKLIAETLERRAGAVAENGKIDFHERGGLAGVEKDQLLAILEMPTPGTPGKNVLGQPIAAKPGKKPTLPQGTGTKVVNHGLELRADRSGDIRYIDGHFEVLDTLRVEGDLDFRQGNIDCEASVIIEGDVLPGFSIRAGGNVTVGGSVDNAIIKSGGKVDVAEGILRHSQVFAYDTIQVGIVSQSYVQSENNVVIKREAMRSVINAAGTITIAGHGRAIGGALFGRQGVEVGEAGKGDGSTTILAVGVDQFEKMQQARLQADLSQVQTVLAKLLALNLADEKESERHKKITDLIAKQQQQQEELQKQLDDLNSKRPKCTASSCRVKVVHEFNEGVRIQIGDKHLLINEKRNGGTFALDEEMHEIVEVGVGGKK